MAYDHLRILLKKNLLILKITYILTFFEIITPMIIMLILWLTKSKFKTEHEPIYLSRQYISYNCTSISKNNKLFNNQCSYRGFIYHCGNKIIALIGKNFPHEIEEKIRDSFWEIRRSSTINRLYTIKRIFKW